MEGHRVSAIGGEPNMIELLVILSKVCYIMTAGEVAEIL